MASVAEFLGKSSCIQCPLGPIDDRRCIHGTGILGAQFRESGLDENNVKDPFPASLDNR